MLLATSRHLLSTECLKLIYYAHVFSHLSYGLLISGPMSSKKSIKELSQIQDACILCIVCKQSKTADIKPLYNKLKCLRLPELTTLELVKYGYKISNKLYPAKLHELAETDGGLKRHHYPTRYKNTPNKQKHKTKKFNSNHLCKGLAAYSSLPKRLKDLKSTKLFTREVKK